MKRLMGILVLVSFAFISACASDGSYHDETSAKAMMNEEKAAAAAKADAMMEEKKRLAAEEKAAMEAKRAAMEAKQAAMEAEAKQAETAAKSMHEEEMDHSENTSGFNNKVSVCKHGSQVRIISVVYNKSGSSSACEVNYEKDTGIKTLWTAKSDVDYCMERATEFVGKQEGWGWDCSALE